MSKKKRYYLTQDLFEKLRCAVDDGGMDGLDNYDITLHFNKEGKVDKGTIMGESVTQYVSDVT